MFSDWHTGHLYRHEAPACTDSPAVRDPGKREKVTSTVVFRVSEGEGELDRELEKGVRD